jgi:quinol monooxygenase YgiN
MPFRDGRCISREDSMPDDRKFIIGWLTCRPGKRDELVALAGPYVAACRAEDGCLFFEMNPSIHEPDVVTVAECFSSAGAHEVHLRQETFQTLWRRLPDLCLSGRFENIFADQVKSDSVDFTAPH